MIPVYSIKIPDLQFHRYRFDSAREIKKSHTFPPHTPLTALHPTGIMPKPLQHEDWAQLAIEDLTSDKIPSILKAAVVFDVIKSTLYERVKDGIMRQQSRAKQQKLRPI